MRIISGLAGGVTLGVPRGETRPTTDRVRGAMFSILNPILEGSRVLDLFAGSGALGLEALSRGAKDVVMVDFSAQAVKVIRDNVAKCRMGDKARVVQGDAVGFVKRESRAGARYDLVFADPPYVKNAGDRDWIAALLEAGVADLVVPGGYLVVEAQAGGGEGYEVEGLELRDRREYGKNAILFYLKLES